MFCAGECFKDKKRCGLLYDVILENTKTKLPETVQKCVFHHLLDSFLRQETGQIRLQATVESSRNEKERSDNIIAQVIQEGFKKIQESVKKREEIPPELDNARR